MMNSNLSRPFIGVRLHKNRTPTGRHTSTPARRAALYFAYGRDKAARLEGKQRGEWLGPDGRVHTHDQVMAWAKREALNHRYTFEAVLSVPRGEPAPAEFCRAMRMGGRTEGWRLMAHHDTRHRHAHVLFFGDKRWHKKEFLTWQTAVRQALAQLAQQSSAANQAGLETKVTQPDETPEPSLRQFRRQEMGQGW